MLSDSTVTSAASTVYGSVGLNAMENPDCLNIPMSVNEFPMDTVLSAVVPYFSMKWRTLMPLSLRSTFILPSPVRRPSS